MKLGDIIFWAGRQIKTRLIESLLIILGIGLGIAVICSVLGLIDSFQDVSAEAEQFYRQFNVRSIENNYSFEQRDRALTLLGEFGEKREKLKLEDYFKFREADLEGTKYMWISEMIWVEQDSESSESSPENFTDYEEQRKWERTHGLQICMATPDIFQLAKLELLSGDIFRDSDLLNQSKVVVLGKKVAENKFPNEDPIGKTMQINEGNFTVIGVVETELDVEKNPYVVGIGSSDNLDYLLYIPFSNDEMHELNFLVSEDADVADYYARLKNYVHLNYENNLSVMGYFIYQQEGQKQMFAMSKTIGIFAMIALLIAAINILNLMLARVFRRYKHIGISVAVGASKKDVFRLFICEAIVLGILGSIVGILFSIGANYLMKTLINQRVQFSLINSLIGVGIAFVTSLLFGLYPASQAAKIDPVDALRVD